MKNIIVFGASGQLGQCLQVVSSSSRVEHIHFLSEQEADILDREKVKLLFTKYQPAYCINCAAYTAVDLAEDQQELAGKINRDGASILADFCRQFDTTLIHISTDFVFAGDSPRFLNETDEARPINVYGLTKLEGEKIIADTFSKYYIIRTSWLYSEYGNNFVKTMLKLGREKPELKIIADQVGTPTYAIDLAGVILHIIQQNIQAYGIYHFSNEGVTSWYDFAKAIFDLSAIKIKVLPVKSTEYITKAKRPAFSVMDKSKIKTTLGIGISYWRESLSVCIHNLLKEK